MQVSVAGFIIMYKGDVQSFSDISAADVVRDDY